MTQFEDRRQQRIDRATAKRHNEEWVKHTINLRKGTPLDLQFQECGNKSHLVRETFKQYRELQTAINHYREENQIMRENIAKLQARLVEDQEEVIMHPGQTTFEVEE